MSEYQSGKDVALLEQRINQQEVLIEQIYKIIDHNIKKKILEEAL